jgi:hypothetical protein
MPHFSRETNTALHFGQRISVKPTRCVSFGAIEYPHFGHSVFNDERLGTKPPRMSAPMVHISGGTFHQSPVAVGSQVSQTVNISASSDELLARLREEVRAQVVDVQKQSEIMLHIDALEEAKERPSIIERYNKFVGVIGDHVTVFGPVLGLLLQRLMGS